MYDEFNRNPSYKGRYEFTDFRHRIEGLHLTVKRSNSKYMVYGIERKDIEMLDESDASDADE
eukprot:18005-Hanusia_phi.AAC.1